MTLETVTQRRARAGKPEPFIVDGLVHSSATLLYGVAKAAKS